MIEKTLKGSSRYYMWLAGLAALCGVGGLLFINQYVQGLGVTGMSRDVSWGFYIAQLTFFVGVAASAVMVVLPYYLHDYKEFGKITILGEFLAIPAVLLSMTFVVVDMGQPFRLGNVFLYPSFSSPMFWDTVALAGYLGLNIVIGWKSLDCERNGVKPPRWLKPFIYISIPWAVSIHTVTAFLYCGLPGRGYWFTAIMAPRFLASAFAAGPALLILLVLLVRKLTSFDAGDKAIRALAKIVTYAMILNIFFLLLEVFTVFYSGMEHHQLSFRYLYWGLGEMNHWVPFMWLAALMSVASLVLLINPATRNNLKTLTVAAFLVFGAIWIDKGIGMMVGGFTPSPLGEATSYIPTLPEIGLVIAIYAMGALVLTLLYKMAVTVKAETAQEKTA